MSFYYLSNPYQGTEAQRKERAHLAAETTLFLLKQGIPVFSPIVHNHSLVQEMPELSTEERRLLFLPFDFVMLKVAKRMIVLKLEGWEHSHGVKAEINFCEEHHIPVVYANLEELKTPEILNSLG
ncbi:MAG TPA: DUF1937 family protein [Coxiellaceae bacterium]|nr:DUF1937 family protein [Coxiellaceae bacterium]